MFKLVWSSPFLKSTGRNQNNPLVIKTRSSSLTDPSNALSYVQPQNMSLNVALYIQFKARQDAI